MLGFAGCSGEASHIPPLWQLPGAAVSSAIGNAAYDARRGEVKRLVTLHEQAMVAEIGAGGGPHLMAAMDTARVPGERRAALLSELWGNPQIYRHPDNRDRLDIEAVTVALMVYGN